jgi:hypothetical protein
MYMYHVIHSIRTNIILWIHVLKIDYFHISEWEDTSHIVGLLKSLQGLKLHNFTHVPDQQCCTSIPQQWHIPRGNKIQPVPVNHVVARPLEGRKRRRILCQVDNEEK